MVIIMRGRKKVLKVRTTGLTNFRKDETIFKHFYSLKAFIKKSAGYINTIL